MLVLQGKRSDSGARNNFLSILGHEALRQGLNRIARKAASAWAARCGGDLGSPRKPAGPATCRCGLLVKARGRPTKNHSKSNFELEGKSERA